MGLLIFMICFIFEIAFVIYSIVQHTKLNKWRMQRVMVSCGELVIYLLMLILPGVDFGFRFRMFFIVMGIRILIEGICLLAVRRKAARAKTQETTEMDTAKKPVGAIIGAISGILVIGFGLIPAFLFTGYDGLQTTGEHQVVEAKVILVDSSRLKSFETDGSNREVPVHFYYPADMDGTEQYPLVVFSHGAFGYYQSNASTFMELASNGYVVVSLDHPNHSFFTEDTEGNLITVDPNFMNEVFYINEDTTSEEEILELFSKWLVIRDADIEFALDSIIKASAENALTSSWYLGETQENTILTILSGVNCDKIGLLGHSLGGAASVSIGRKRSDIDAVIDLDGSMDGEILGYDNSQTYEWDGITYPTALFEEEPYPVPILSIDNEEHHISAGQMGSLYVNNAVIEHALDGQNTYFVGAGHMNFTDLPLFSPTLASLLGTGSIDEMSCITTMNDIVLHYFDQYLKDGEAYTVKESYGSSGNGH